MTEEMISDVASNIATTTNSTGIMEQILSGSYGIAYAILGAAIAISFGCAGSAIGVASVASVGSGLMRERADLYGKILLLVVMPGTQGIYGFLGAFWVMLKLNILSGDPTLISNGIGLSILWSSLPVGLAGFVSGIYQGKVAAAGIGVIAKDQSNLGKSIILSAMVETYAVLGLLVTILLINGIKLG